MKWRDFDLFSDLTTLQLLRGCLQALRSTFRESISGCEGFRVMDTAGEIINGLPNSGLSEESATLSFMRIHFKSSAAHQAALVALLTLQCRPV